MNLNQDTWICADCEGVFPNSAIIHRKSLNARTPNGIELHNAGMCDPCAKQKYLGDKNTIGARLRGIIVERIVKQWPGKTVSASPLNLDEIYVG